MEENENRRGFFKTTSISAAVIIMMSCVLWSSTVDMNKGPLPIIMVYDSRSFVGGVADQEIVQNMVDVSVVELTGVVGDISFAYECLFPYGGITDSTKILIKYNPKTSATTRKPMVDALKKGLMYMLDSTFSEDNIAIVGDEGTANTNDTIFIDTTGANLKYVIKDLYVNADYIIYCPSAWGTDIGCGVDMSLNLMTSSIEGVGSTTIEDMYPYFHDTISPSLSLLNYHPTFNGDYEKVCLYMMDLLSYSGTGDSADLKPGYKIYTTQNITVCDWKGIRFLRDSVDAIDSLQEWQALKVCSLSCVPYVDLGVVNEGQMLEIPLTLHTGVITPGYTISQKGIQVKTNQAYTVFSYPREEGSHAVIVIYDIHGREIWSHRSSEKSIVWNNNDLHGQKISSGVYLYQLNVGEIKARGKIAIKR